MNTITNFWRNLSTTGKAITVAIIVVIAFIAYNFFKNQNQNQATNPSGNTVYAIIRDENSSDGGFRPPNPGHQSIPPQPNPGPGPTPTPSAPLIPSGQWPQGVQWKFGNTVSWKGTTYTIGPGSNNRIWGVPGTGWSLSDWNRVPIQAGGKVLLYQG